MAKRTQLVTIAAAPAAFPGVANVQLDFNARSIVVVNEAASAADIVFVSFDGSTDEARLVPGTASAGLRLEREARDFFIRGINAPFVSVIAED